MINIFKIGGNVIDNSDALDKFLSNFSKIKGPKILVHGGGKEATALGKRLGIEAKMVNGRRITDRETLDIVTMVYAGLINKRIVALLQSKGCDAIGLTGADGNVIKATKRNPEPIDFGYVGDIDPADINSSFILKLLQLGTVPVFCAICHDKAGMLLNCNADTIASSVAVAMSKEEPTRLTYCFEKPGVLKDKDDDSSVIPLITSEVFDKLVDEKIVADGMIPKIHNALNATAAGVEQVRICSSEDIGNDKGTIIRN